MPQLDPVLHHPMRTGPTRDMQAIAAREPVYRQERFQLQPKRLPVSLNANMKARPVARSGSGTPVRMSMKRLPVLVRQSNQRPLEAGEGTEAQRWGLSDPGAMMPGMGGDALPGMGTLPAGSGMLLALGVAAGVGLYLLKRR